LETISAMEKTSLGEIFRPNSGLEFLPLLDSFTSWSSWRGSFRPHLLT